VKVDRTCENNRCGQIFQAKTADVRRGWARFCSRSCKATVQSYGRGTKPGNFEQRRERLGPGEFFAHGSQEGA